MSEVWEVTSKLKVLDLFSGTQSIARAFRDNGHETYTIELDKKHNGIDWYEDIMNITENCCKAPCFSCGDIRQYFSKKNK